jgi:hypothetical protein
VLVDERGAGSRFPACWGFVRGQESAEKPQVCPQVNRELPGFQSI